uniref:Decapping nuclease n=1 Tax=Strongyloides stercoralis TaxID=6248 RepID=A0A0K0E7Q0_STRER
MSVKYSEPVKLFSFRNQRREDGKDEYIFGEKLFPVYNSYIGNLNLSYNLKSKVEIHLKKPYTSKIVSHWDVMAYIQDTVDMSLKQITDNADVVCYRSFLTDLALLPLGGTLSNTFVAFLHNGIVFIEKVQTPIYPITVKDIEKEYMKKNFARICTLVNSKESVDMKSSVNLDEKYYTTKTRVFKMSNSTIKVMFTGEVYAITRNYSSEESNFMDVKVCTGNLAHLYNGMCLYHTWAKNYIDGNKWIIVGITGTRKHQLRKIQLVTLSDLESKLPLPVPRIMEYVGKSLENIVNTCRRFPKKYVIIPHDKFSLRVADKETVESMYYSKPTSSFVESFPE